MCIRDRVGASISLIATVGIFASQVYMMIHFQAGEVAQFMRGIWAVGNLCRAAGLALMVTAIFVDRPEAGPRDRYLRE